MGDIVRRCKLRILQDCAPDRQIVLLPLTMDREIRLRTSIPKAGVDSVDGQ